MLSRLNGENENLRLQIELFKLKNNTLISDSPAITYPNGQITIVNDYTSVHDNIISDSDDEIFKIDDVNSPSDTTNYWIKNNSPPDDEQTIS